MAESKSRKRILNAAMIAMASVVVVAGFMLASSLKAPVQEPNSELGVAVAAVGQVGNVCIERGGAGFSLDEGSSLQDGDYAAGTASSPAAGSGSGSSDSGMKTCTIEIRCDTILDNMGELSEGKGSLVPANGIILARSTVQFSEGDTVFDVLKAACAATGLHIEYSYTPLYESYYIEGINNLYEFDCGPESGWTYKVNGWFPNYGCSSYELEDGDSITWCYTCKGLGADVGGGMNR